MIRQTIESVLNQSYHDLEYVVIDGASTDGTLEIIKHHKDKIHQLISEPDNGIYDAMNKGLRTAKGEFVLFMNSGDEFYDNNVLERIFENPKSKTADIIYGETMLINESRNEIGIRSELSTRKLPSQLKSTSFLKGMLVCHQSFIARRSLVKPYNVNYKCSADIDWCIDAMINAKKMINAHLIIAKYLVGGHSIKNQKRCWKERFIIQKKYYGLFLTTFSLIRTILISVLWKLQGRHNY